jgi:hypothetical protein
VFGAGHVLVATVPRDCVKMVFACLCFNLVQLGTGGWAVAWANDLLLETGWSCVDVCGLGVENGAVMLLGG